MMMFGNFLLYARGGDVGREHCVKFKKLAYASLARLIRSSIIEEGGVEGASIKNAILLNCANLLNCGVFLHKQFFGLSIFGLVILHS